MRYAVFSDIHANLQAWNAVLRDMRELEADVLVCLGDVIGYGPMPEQVLNAIRAETQNFVIGNHDAAAVGVYINSDLFNPQAKLAIDWTREQLSEESKRFLAETPLTLESDEMLFVHAEISEPSRFEYISDVESASENLASNNHFITFVGHTHHPIIFDRSPNGKTLAMVDDDCQLEEGHRYIVNVGSVGEPRNPDDIRARYVIYDSDTRELYFRRIEFDHDAYRKVLAASGLGVTPFFLRILDHSALLDQEALRAVEKEMQTPSVWDPNKLSPAPQIKRQLVTGGSLEANAAKPKPKPLSSQTKSSVNKAVVLIIALLLLAVAGVFAMFLNKNRSSEQVQQTKSPAIVSTEIPTPPAQPSVETKTTPAPEPTKTAKTPAPAPAPAPKKAEPKPAPPAKPTPQPTPPTPTKAEIPVLAYWHMDRDSEDDTLVDGLGNHSLRAITPGRAIDKVAPDPMPQTGVRNTSALTLGVWSEESPAGSFDLKLDSSFTFEGWILVGNDSSPIQIANASNWRLDIKAGEDAKSPGSMRFRLGDEQDPIDLLAREIELHSSDPHHFAVVWNHKGTEPGSGILKLFYDGKEVSSLSIPHSKIINPTPKPFQIGEAANSKRVALDEVRFSTSALNVPDFLTGPVDPVILFQAKFELLKPIVSQNGKTLGDMTLFGYNGSTLQGVEGRQRLIVRANYGRADIFTTQPINMDGIGGKSYRITWNVANLGSMSSPSENRATRGHHLTLREWKGMIAQQGDGTARAYIDFKGISLQFINNNFQLVADTANADGAAVVLTKGTFPTTGKSLHHGFTATLGVDATGWTLKIDGIVFNEGKQPELAGSWKDKGLSPADIFTDNMHLGAGCTASKDSGKISIQGLSVELVPTIRR